jgi:hypothetical protein
MGVAVALVEFRHFALNVLDLSFAVDEAATTSFLL